MPTIQGAFQLLRDNYPFRPLTGDLKAFMESPGIKGGTPCCVQISHALNKGGIKIPKNGFRRDNSDIPYGSGIYYILAVDELARYLTDYWGEGENVFRDANGHRILPAAIKASLANRVGIIVFRDTGPGFHAELWDKTQILQRDMDEQKLFSQPVILFWDVGHAAWNDANSPSAYA